MAFLRVENENIEGIVKLEWDDTGEVRRWPARILKDYTPSRLSAPQDLLALIQGTFGMPTLECMTYFDDEGDAIFVSTGWHSEPLDLEIALEYLSTLKDKCLNLKLHTTKDAAFEYVMKIKKQKKKRSAFHVSELGTRPGLVVALDLGVPVPEARELVRRATTGDEIAIRVVAPSRDYLKELQATDSLDCIYNPRKFVQMHKKCISANSIATQSSPKDPTPLRCGNGSCTAKEQSCAYHWGIVCDGCEQNPIIGTRWHLKGQNFDLCDADYRKLTKEEQAKYQEIKQPLILPHMVHCLQRAREAKKSGIEKTQATQSTEQPTIPPQSPPACDEPEKDMKISKVDEYDDDEKKEEVSAIIDIAQTLQNEPPPPYDEPVVYCNEPDIESVEDLVFITSNNNRSQSPPPPPFPPPPPYADTDLDHALDVSVLTSMGFQDEDASRVLRREGSVAKAVESLIQHEKASQVDEQTSASF